jgi:hypothetical protein
LKKNVSNKRIGKIILVTINSLLRIKRFENSRRF